MFLGTPCSTWHSFNGSEVQFLFCPEPADFPTANASCVGLGGNLSTIAIEQEDEFVKGMVDASFALQRCLNALQDMPQMPCCGWATSMNMWTIL